MPTSQRDSFDELVLEKLHKFLVQRRSNTLVVAERNTAGQLAGALTARLEAEHRPVRRVDATNVSSSFQLLALAGEPDSVHVEADDWLELISTLAESSQREARSRFVVVDQIPNPDVGFGLFGTMRDDLWEIGYRWAAFITPSELGRYRTPPADTFFSEPARDRGVRGG